MKSNINKNLSIGMIGIGLMGLGIATNIQRNGWKIRFLEHPGNQPVDDLVDNGAIGYQSAAQLAQDCDLIIICVTGTPQVEAILFDAEDGVLQALRPGTVIVDCSTAIPSSTIKIAQAIEEAGGRFLDAPMTRTPKEAMEGRLNLLVGGDRELFESHLPLLQSYAENVTYTGPVGTGHSLKLLHNYVSLGFSTVLAEAAACAEQAGVEAKVLVEVLAQGGGAGVVLQRLQPYILEQDNSSFRFSISNAHKDISYYVSMANDLNAPQSAANSILEILARAKDSGQGASTVPELISILNTGCSPAA